MLTRNLLSKKSKSKQFIPVIGDYLYLPYSERLTSTTVKILKAPIQTTISPLYESEGTVTTVDENDSHTIPPGDTGSWWQIVHVPFVMYLKNILPTDKLSVGLRLDGLSSITPPYAFYDECDYVYPVSSFTETPWNNVSGYDDGFKGYGITGYNVVGWFHVLALFFDFYFGSAQMDFKINITRGNTTTTLYAHGR